nr:hypothetical protein BaRGS_030094 [Batillaria attramentaria]
MKYRIVRVHDPQGECSGDFVASQFYLDTVQNGVAFIVDTARYVLFTYIPVTSMALASMSMIYILARHSKRNKESYQQHQAPATTVRNSVDLQMTAGADPQSTASVGPQDSDMSKSSMRAKGPEATSTPFFQLSRQQSLTVLVYTIFFLLLALPDSLQILLKLYIPGFFIGGKEMYLVTTASVIYFLLDVVSSAMNFFVYIASGSLFRAEVCRLLRQMFRCK